MSKRIVLLASGAGSLAKAVIQGIPQENIVALISDKDAPVLQIARDAGIETFNIPMKPERGKWDSEILETVEKLNPDLVLSVGFMRILSPQFVSRFKVMNTHPALLPLYPGAHAVRDALAAGAVETGTTVHWVDEGVDTGPVIRQRAVQILAGDDEASLHERIKAVERELIVEVLRDFLESKV